MYFCFVLLGVAVENAGDVLHGKYEPQWRAAHGYWSGTCVNVDQHGDHSATYQRVVQVDTTGDTYLEHVTDTSSSGPEGWYTEDLGQENTRLIGVKTTVDKVDGSLNVLSRTTNAGNDNSIHTFFYTSEGVLTHSRLVTFRETAGILKRIVSTQEFQNGYAPIGLKECVDTKLSNQDVADSVLNTMSLASTGLHLTTPSATPSTTPPSQSPCNASEVDLATFPQWADESGYWQGELSYFGANMEPNYIPDSWNYPYDHYSGFIVGSINGNSYSQRNVFMYPPQTALLCAANNNTFLDSETCGNTGSLKKFQADQTTEYCDNNDGGRISGPYGDDATTTTLVGTQAVLYQIYSANSSGANVMYQSQMTTITHDGAGNVRRTRTAQFFDKDSGDGSWFSFYRELKVNETFFWDAFNATRVTYDVPDEAFEERCYGGYDNLKSFMEGALDWSGSKYTCPLPPATSDEALYAKWTAAGVAGWVTYYPSQPVNEGHLMTAAQLAIIPGASVQSLVGYGWVEYVLLHGYASPYATWTATGVSGWAVYYAAQTVTEGALLTEAELALIPGATAASLVDDGWLTERKYASVLQSAFALKDSGPYATPYTTWTPSGVTGWAGYFPSQPVTEGTLLSAVELAMIPSGTVMGLVGYGWVTTSGATPFVTWTSAGVSGWAGFYPSQPVTEGALLTAAQLALVPGGTVSGLIGYGWVEPTVINTYPMPSSPTVESRR